MCGIYYIMPEGIIFLRCLVAIYFSAVNYVIERAGRELAHIKLNKMKWKKICTDKLAGVAFSWLRVYIAGKDRQS